MARRSLIIATLLLAGCALPPADQPASPNRMGRFLGLVSNCGCSDVSESRMLAEYSQAVAGRYSDAEIKAMHGYVDMALSEHFDNQIEICKQACSQSCMVNDVAGRLGGRTIAGAGSCLPSERDLHLTEGYWRGDSRN
jgi:hypothetical protein